MELGTGIAEYYFFENVLDGHIGAEIKVEVNARVIRVRRKRLIIRRWC